MSQKHAFSHYEPFNNGRDWSWTDLVSQPSQSDPIATSFSTLFLPLLSEAFLTRRPSRSPLIEVPLEKLTTENKRIRIYYIGTEGVLDNAFVFVRNENAEGVDNWGVSLMQNRWLKAGDFVDFPARTYSQDYGGFMADIFTVSNGTLIGAGIATDAFSSLTTHGSTIYKHPVEPLYMFELKLGNLARVAYAMLLEA